MNEIPVLELPLECGDIRYSGIAAVFPDYLPECFKRNGSGQVDVQFYLRDFFVP